MDITKYNIKILTERNITVAVDDKVAHNALAAQPQPSVAPFVKESYKVKVLLRAMDASWYFGNEISCREQLSPLVGI